MGEHGKRRKGAPEGRCVRVDFSALEAYVMVCREGKMSRAAEKLFLSKQTLSMIIKRIEGEMDAGLLLRTGAGVEMTPEGERFYEYARQILFLWRACNEEIGKMKAGSRTRLAVGFGYMVCNFWTKEMEEAFVREHPQVELSVEGELSRELLEKLEDGHLDMVITCMQTDNYAKYDCALLHTMEPLVTMTQDDPLADRETLTLTDLAGRKLMYPDSGAQFLYQFCRFLETQGVHVDSGLLQAGNFLRNLHTIREERALKLTNSFYDAVVPSVDGYVSRPLRYDGEEEMPRISVYALMPPAELRSPAAEAFIRFLSGEMARILLC